MRKIDIDKIIQMRAEGKTLEEIAKELGSTKQNISSRLWRYNSRDRIVKQQIRNTVLPILFEHSKQLQRIIAYMEIGQTTLAIQIAENATKTTIDLVKHFN